MAVILATTGNQYSSLELVSMNGYSYKIISGNKCLYEYERKANAMKKWRELTNATPAAS